MNLSTELKTSPNVHSGIGWDVLGLLLVAGSVFFANLGGAKLWDRDEPRNAGCAVEMLQRGDWVTPMFNDELRGQKPVLTYWLMMSAISVFGVNEFAVRFWSAALGVGTVLLTYLWVRHLLFPAIARWTGMVLATTLMFTLASRAATPDAPLIFCSTLSIAAYVLLTFKPSLCSNWDEVLALGRADRLRRPGCWFPATTGAFLVYAAMALGVLAKGPVAFVLPTMVIGLFILIESSAEAFYSEPKNRRDASTGLRWWFRRSISVVHPRGFIQAVWQMKPWWLVLAVVTISLPWFVWVGMRTDGEFLRLFFFREHFERATSAMEGHRGGWWFYPLTIVVGVFPWSILAIPAILVWRKLANSSPAATGQSLTTSTVNSDLGGNVTPGQWTSAWTLAAVWIGLQVAVFSLASTKLPSYVTPCYPAVALLLAMVPTQLGGSNWSFRPFWLRAGFATWVLTGIAVASVLVYVCVHTMQWAVGWLPILGGVLILGGIIGWFFYERRQLERVAKTMFVTSWVFVVLAFGYATDYVSRYRATDDLWQIARQHQSSGALLAGYRDLESTWVFYAGQPIWELTVQGPERVDGSVTGPSDPFAREYSWQVKPRTTVEQLVRHRPGSLIVTPEKFSDELLAQLPSHYERLASRTDFLTRNQLVLIGPRPESGSETSSEQQHADNAPAAINR